MMASFSTVLFCKFHNECIGKAMIMISPTALVAMRDWMNGI